MGKTVALVLAGLWLFNLARLVATGLPGDAPHSPDGDVPRAVPVTVVAAPGPGEPLAPASAVDAGAAAPAEEAAAADSTDRTEPLALDAMGAATSDPE